MIPLDSPEWTQLKHCYGPALDIPALLRAAEVAPRQQGFRDEPWCTLWSSLCHQDDVFPASYAALPHLIALATRRAPQDRDEPLLLAAAIEVSRASGRGPALPPALQAAYNAALITGAHAASTSLDPSLPEQRLQVLLAAVAVFSGFPALGDAILELSPQQECPSCGETICPPGYDRFKGA
jgi:hypothetical protein